MTNPRELRRRIRSIGTIERTVDALQKISAARLAREKTALLSTRAYTDAVIRVVQGLAAADIPLHPLLESPATGGYMLLAIASDKGMCGAHSANVIRATREFVARQGSRHLTLLTCGRKLRRFLPHTTGPVVRERLQFRLPLDHADAEAVAGGIAARFLQREVAEVYFLYTAFKSVAGNRPVVRRFLPVEFTEPRPAHTHSYLFEPEATQILDRLLRQYLATAVWRAFNEASATEHAARMVMMEQASVSARRMIGDLTLTANKLRQGMITRELSDIVGTAEALA